ncbi:hypothetical protein E0H75_04470 [Kribbella capetownensis]|uniref:Uncharacterized protein n=1 Tax=Kribbella capetownensis TaxID=1572659 RepID=A0A4R0K0L2_9ACTN|nr:DUF6049 family protein [Kribbella capetownensis]TCC52999.1 hypothetical protein E0H75_04470 [Kribbella capetownensis]
MFRRRLRLSAAAGAGLLVVACAAFLGVQPTAAAPGDELTVDVSIDSFAPVAPKPGDPVVIKGRVTNTSSVTFDEPQALACIDRTRLSSSADIADVSAEQDVAMRDRDSCANLTDGTAFQPFEQPLAPKASVEFTLTVPWEQWRISDRTGAYVVGVVFRGQPPNSDRVTIGRSRTLMPVIGTDPLTRKVNTALVIPLRHRPTQLGGSRFTNDSLAQSLSPTGSLGRLLALGKQHTVTWLVDPAMLDEVRQMAKGYEIVGSGGQTTKGTGQATAAAWFKEFEASRIRGDQVVLLPYGDPDVAGLLDAGEPLKKLIAQARTTTERYNLAPAFTNGLWLEGGAAASRYLAAASGGFAGATDQDLNLVSSSSWSADDRAALTNSPVYDVITPEGPNRTVRTVIADSALTSGGPDADGNDSPLQVRQRFAAETALIASEGKDKNPATVVALPPRGWDVEGQATAALAGSLTLPWITATDVDQAVASTPKPPTTKAPAAPKSNGGLTGPQLDGIKQLDEAITTMQNLLANPDDLLQVMPQALLRSTSTSWRGFPDEARYFSAVELGSVNLQLNKVHLVNNPVNGERREIKVNLAGSKGTFPLTITNSTQWSVRVAVVVTPANRTDLRIEPQQSRILAAGQKWTPRINASAEQNGLIRANAQVITSSGRPVGDSEELLIQASQYGSVGWVLVGAACALLFGTSFVRIYRRIRTERRNPSHPPTEATPDPLHPAPLETTTGDPAPDELPEASLKEGVGSKDG